MRKSLFISFAILAFASIAVFLILNSKDLFPKPLRIGAYDIGNESRNYAGLSYDIKERLGLETEFVELTPLDENANPAEHLMQTIKQSELDMVLGVPNVHIQQIINADVFADITDDILELGNIQKSVVDVALKIGNGKLYFISPVITECYYLFENKDLLRELDMAPVNGFITWDDFFARLGKIESKLQILGNSEVKPLAMVVQNEGEEAVFAEDDFFMFGYGLDSPLVYNNKLLGHSKWSDYFLRFSEMISKYGSNYSEIDQRFIFNTHFSNGNYVASLGGNYQLELYTKDNMKLNDVLPAKVNLDFELSVSPLPVSAGDEGMLNIRLSSMAISKASKRKAESLRILNFILSKDYAMKMIEHRYEYSNLGAGIPFFPAYFDDETIKRLNEMYDGKFDASLIYNADRGAVTYPVQDSEKRGLAYRLVSEALADVFNKKKSGEDALKTLLEGSFSE
ncbi:MAG: extracellular solute-binding protein [Clostridiales bacterium]|jgi:ABC-type glycerol-3-phosphate transport system substrate-binding protein|nr:extracellular solute-binding protein [Clostridiales bacterium]MDR2751014.1 extracellular solute-binding protein [Clostridiales bacterium]